MQKGTDFAYVQHLADEAGYVFYITPGPAAGDEPGLLGAAGPGRAFRNPRST